MDAAIWTVSEPNKPVVVFFEDEARFGRISRELYCWVPKRYIPSVARQMVREYLYAFSAISPQTGDCYSIIAPRCDTAAMSNFLSLFAKKYDDYRIVLILDKAGWHRSKTLKLPHNISMLHLPPYSPELNPVELLWRELRRKYFHNRIFKSLDQVEEQLSDALKEYHQNKEAIKRLSSGFLFSNIDGG